MPDQYGPYRKFKSNLEALKQKLGDNENILEDMPDDKIQQAITQALRDAVEIME